MEVLAVVRESQDGSLRPLKDPPESQGRDGRAYADMYIFAFENMQNKDRKERYQNQV